MSFHDLLMVGALYPAGGLLADALASYALRCRPRPVCTAIAMASDGVVTDITDVPADTVRSQLEHLARTSSFSGIKIGALAGHHTAEAVFAFCSTHAGPLVLDVHLSGSHGETLLTARGIEVLRRNLHAPDLVVIGRTDAELISGGEINSLDDAQVAAQRIVKQGARALVIKCGQLPARHFDRQEAVILDETYSADLYYDGREFALFEAPHIQGVRTEGASSAFSVAILGALTRGLGLLDAVQEGKRFVTESLRATKALGPGAPLQYFGQAPSLAPGSHEAG